MRQRFNWTGNILMRFFKATIGVLYLKCKEDNRRNPRSPLLTAQTFKDIVDHYIQHSSCWETFLETQSVWNKGQKVQQNLTSILEWIKFEQPGPEIDYEKLATLAAHTAHGSKNPNKDIGDWWGIEPFRDDLAREAGVAIPQAALDMKPAPIKPVKIIKTDKTVKTTHQPYVYYIEGVSDLKQELEVIRNRIDAVIGKIK